VAPFQRAVGVCDLVEVQDLADGGGEGSNGGESGEPAELGSVRVDKGSIDAHPSDVSGRLGSRVHSGRELEKKSAWGNDPGRLRPGITGHKVEHNVDRSAAKDVSEVLGGVVDNLPAPRGRSQSCLPGLAVAMT
jgi:hypothetical protein